MNLQEAENELLKMSAPHYTAQTVGPVDLIAKQGGQCTLNNNVLMLNSGGQSIIHITLTNQDIPWDKTRILEAGNRILKRVGTAEEVSQGMIHEINVQRKTAFDIAFQRVQQLKRQEEIKLPTQEEIDNTKVPEVVVIEREVERVVEIEKPIEVEKIVEVEKVVERVVEVEKLVEVDKIVEVEKPRKGLWAKVKSWFKG